MRRAFVAVSRTAFNAIYRMTRRDVREDTVVFLSRQTDEPSYDFAQLAHEFERRGWTAVMHLKKVRARNIVPYALHVLRELRLLGRCKLAVLDRYDPVVSLLNFECDEADAISESEREARHKCHSERSEESPRSGDPVLPLRGDPSPSAQDDRAGAAQDDRAGAAQDDTKRIDQRFPNGFIPRNVEFPRKPVVLQMWHAFGAFKKFGHQSVGTMEGHSASFTEAYDIHRNYSWVLCSGSGARQAFAEAFSCPPERVIPLVRPEFDELVAARADREARSAVEGEARRFTILMAPTLRKSHESAHPFRELYEDRDRFESGIDAEFCWSFHPLEEKRPAPGNVSDQLLSADLLVTDYSSIAYEAYVLGIPTLFYVPDVESYRESPGLNADPGKLCPELCAFTADDLLERLHELEADPDSYNRDAFAAFAATGFDPDAFTQSDTAASRIADFAIEKTPM